MIGKRSTGSAVFDAANYAILTALVIVCVYPVYYVVAASVSNPVALYRGSKFLLWPREFSLATYKLVFQYPAIWTGYANTLLYVGAGVAISLALTVCGAFGLSRSYLIGRVAITMFIVFTMYFSGGMIPSFLLIRSLGMYDSRWAMLLPGAVSTFNLIIMLTYFRGIPESLEEAAKIDGASEYRILCTVYLPLCAPVLAVIALYYAVAKWNSYFQALIYLRSRTSYPLQLILREILIQNDQSMVSGGGAYDGLEAYAQNVKYASIVVATVPILTMYPFLQKYFVKGIMIGAVKG
ncbi:MAG: carbohydrate ABC transporter permease [Oscillospiraceae bacterium]|jgi:putative aldouronate transport system permease protein|nr:carbohydrate ABC transporter permease [Oscillospiraceae bacterium]